MTSRSPPDPQRDCQEIARYLATMACPWDTTHAGEFLAQAPLIHRFRQVG